MAKLLKRRTILIGAIAVIAVAAIVVGASFFVSNQLDDATAARFSAAQESLIDQVEADDDAHAALNTVETSGFATSASKVVAALQSCLGKSAVTTTTGGLAQLAGFEPLRGGARVVLPLVREPSAAAADKLAADLATDKAKTAETQADVQANLIAQDEINQDLYGIAASIGGTSTKLVSKDTYATGSVKDAYKKSVADVATAVSQTAPSLTAKRAIKITSAQSAALIKSLTNFAFECNAEAASSKAHKPKPIAHVSVSSGFPDWHLNSWFPNGIHPSGGLYVAGFSNAEVKLSCTSEKLLEEGTVTGKPGTLVNAPFLHTGAFAVKFLTRDISATTAQYAWVECK